MIIIQVNNKNKYKNNTNGNYLQETLLRKKKKITIQLLIRLFADYVLIDRYNLFAKKIANSLHNQSRIQKRNPRMQRAKYN